MIDHIHTTCGAAAAAQRLEGRSSTDFLTLYAEEYSLFNVVNLLMQPAP